jgi:predicted nucleic acid-binding protein
MNGSIFVDTNVLVYTRDASKPDKQTQAAEGAKSILPRELQKS